MITSKLIFNIGIVFIAHLLGTYVLSYENINTTEIYEPVKTICEAFGFQNSLRNNISQEETQDEIPNQMKNMNMHQSIRLLRWSCRYIESDVYTLVITFTAPSYHDALWQWSNKVEPYRGSIPVHDGDCIHTSKTVYSDWFYRTEFNISRSRSEILNLKYRISLVISSGTQHVSISIRPFTNPKLGSGSFDKIHFAMHEKGMSDEFRIFHTEHINQNETAHLSGIYAYFDWIEQTENGDLKEKSFLLERSHVSKNPIGTIENYSATNSSVNCDIHLRNSVCENGGILRVINWVIWKSNGILEQYTNHIPINGGYQTNIKTCTSTDLPGMLPEVLKGTTAAIECTCVGNPAPHIRITKDRTDSSSEMKQLFFRKISVGFRNKLNLILFNITHGMTGNYTCSGIDEDGTIITQTTFALTYGESTTVVPNSLITKDLQNNKTLLTFRLNGNPTPKSINCKYRYSNISAQQVISSDNMWVEELSDNEIRATFQVPNSFIGIVECEVKRNSDNVLTGKPERLLINVEKGLGSHVMIDVIV